MRSEDLADHFNGLLQAFIAGWSLRQSEVDDLQKRVDALTLVMEGLLEEMKYPTATFEEVICSGVKELEQALNGEGTPKKIPDIYGRCDFKPEPLKTSEDEE